MTGDNVVDLTKLLVAALDSDTDRDRLVWFREFAGQFPLWTRQQPEFERRWGRQTTGIFGVSPWAVVSRRLEQAAPWHTSIGLARLALEFIAEIDVDRPLSAAELVARADRQELENLRATEQTVDQGSNQGKTLLQIRRQGGGTRGADPVLRSDEVNALATEAEDWLSVVRTAVDQTARIGLEGERWSVCCPFLHPAELDWIRSGLFPAQLRVAASHLLIHRIFGAVPETMAPTPRGVATDAYGNHFQEEWSSEFPTARQEYHSPIA